MKRAAKALSLALLVATTFRLAVDVATASWARLRFPFDLDWIEGGQLAHALRILEGRPIFGAADFLPHPYPPFHYALLAGIGRFTGLGLTMSRVFSIAMWAIAIAIGVTLLAREAGRQRDGQSLGRLASASVAVAGIGLSLRAYPFASGWFDLGRSDTLLLMLVLAAGALSIHESTRSAVAAGLLLAAATFTKQTAIFFAASLVIMVALRSWRRALTVVAAFIVPSVAAFVALEIASGGAFHVWIFSTGGHPIDPRRIGQGLITIVRACPVLLAVPYLTWFARCSLSRTSIAFAFMLVAALPAGLLPYGKMYGAPNNLVPLFVIAALAPLSLAIDVWHARPRERGWLSGALAFALLGVIASGSFDSRRFAPPPEVARAMAANLAEVKALPGTVECPVHPFLAHQLGKGPAQTSWLSFIDARAAGRAVSRDAFVADLLARGADWIVLTNMSVEWEGDLERGIQERYVWDHNFATPTTGVPDTFHSMPRMAFRRVR